MGMHTPPPVAGLWSYKGVDSILKLTDRYEVKCLGLEVACQNIERDKIMLRVRKRSLAGAIVVHYWVRDLSPTLTSA